MSDDETPVERPKIDMAALRERNERLRREADASQLERERAESEAIMRDLAATAERQIAAFRVLPCKGEVARIGECSASFAADCERRTTPSCPRRIVELDEAKAAAELAAQLERAKVPQRVRDAISAGFYQTPATLAVDDWLASGKCLLLLAGDFGTGKSVAAGYALKRRPGLWMHSSEMVAIADDDRFHGADRLKALQRARLLVVDEIGKEQDSGSTKAKAALTSLLLTRYEERLPTVMTCNLGGKAWKEYVDPRIPDRLAGDGVVFGTAGPSLRRA
jgi:DNA replication protein DnaC